jgi:hypothetical protein
MWLEALEAAKEDNINEIMEVCHLSQDWHLTKNGAVARLHFIALNSYEYRYLKLEQP